MQENNISSETYNENDDVLNLQSQIDEKLNDFAYKILVKAKNRMEEIKATQENQFIYKLIDNEDAHSKQSIMKNNYNKDLTQLETAINKLQRS